jgi:sugar phosphate isomerase/epimerase
LLVLCLSYCVVYPLAYKEYAVPSIKGPAIFLAQFLRDEEPYNNLENIGRWVARLGYKGVQIPTWDGRVFDRDTAAESKTYCDEYKGKLNEMGLEITELASYLSGQVLAIHPAYEIMFEGFHPAGLKGNERTEWAAGELKKSVDASVNMGTDLIPTLSGGFAWHMIYPWPQRPEGIIDEAFKELAKRWKPLLDYAHDKGQAFGYELHPGSDITRLSGVHPTLWNPYQGLPRQGCRVPTDRSCRCLRWLPILGGSSRPIPVLGRRSS